MIRVWHPRMGLGSLDFQAIRCEFKPDSGESVSFTWARAKVGKAGKQPKGKAALAEWEEWLTYTTFVGEVFTFRRNGPPAVPEDGA